VDSAAAAAASQTDGTASQPAQLSVTSAPVTTTDIGAVLLPFIDCCVAQMNERFSRQALIACQLTALMPAHCTSSKFSTDIEPVASFYASLLPSGDSTSAQMEFLRWQQYWRCLPAETAKPDTAVEALRTATELHMYPAICVLLQIYARHHCDWRKKL